MNPYYTKEEGRAVISVVIDMVVCDDNVAPQEQVYVDRLASKLGLTHEDVQYARRLTPPQVYTVFSAMGTVKRRMATKMILFASLADGRIANAERRMSQYLEMAGIMEPLSDSEYEPYAISRDVNAFLNS